MLKGLPGSTRPFRFLVLVGDEAESRSKKKKWDVGEKRAEGEGEIRPFVDGEWRGDRKDRWIQWTP